MEPDDKINEAMAKGTLAFCAVVFFVWLGVEIQKERTEAVRETLTKQLQMLKTEAADKGFAEYKINNEGTIVFDWKKPLQEVRADEWTKCAVCGTSIKAAPSENRLILGSAEDIYDQGS